MNTFGKILLEILFWEVGASLAWLAITISDSFILWENTFADGSTFFVLRIFLVIGFAVGFLRSVVIFINGNFK